MLRRPQRFDFFQAVRLLERINREEAARDAGASRHAVGGDVSPEREVVRFRASSSLSFPASPITQLERRDQPGDGRAAPPVEMTVSFMGLTGPSGVLADHYTSLVIRRVRQKDHALRDFLDLFNHRAISLFYRAWRKHRVAVEYERVRLDGREDDLFSECLYALAGLACGHLRSGRAIDASTFVFYSGQFVQNPPNASSLSAMLAEYFDAQVEVRQFVGQWLALAADQQSRLSRGRGHASAAYNELGVTAVAGSRVWDVQSKFRIVIGPLGYAEFRQYMPTGDRLRSLADLTRSYVGPELDFDVQLRLARDETPTCRLTRQLAVGNRLGWNAWLAPRVDSRRRVGAAGADDLETQSTVDDAVFRVDFN